MISASQFRPTHVVYHHPCSDGFTAAWAAHKYDPELQLLPYDHDTAVPENLGPEARVVMIDCCFKREDLLRFRGLVSDLLVLDHHQTSLVNCGDLPFCYFNPHQSGASLAWDFFFPGQEPPLLVRYVQDQDLHTHRYGETRDFIPALYRRGFSLEWWDEVSSLNQATPEGEARFQQFLQEGLALREHFSHLLDEMCDRAFPAKFFGHEVLCANAPYPFHSAVANRLAYNHKVDFAVSFGFDRVDRVRVSLRSRSDGMSVLAVAERLGGGGHEHAAGAIVSAATFFPLLSV